MPELSIVVPCYNEGKSIHELIEGFVKAIEKAGMEGKIELVLVDNGSSDGSKQVMKKEIAERGIGFAKIVRVEKNIGYGNGILQGLSVSSGNYLSFTHADLQCKPEDVFRAYARMKDEEKKGLERKVLAKGNREGRFSVLTAGLHFVAGAVLLKKFDDINGQPKVFPRELFEGFGKAPLDFSFDLYVQYMALKNGYKIVSVPVVFCVRKFGFSHWARGIKSRLVTIIRFFYGVFLMRVGGLK